MQEDDDNDNDDNDDDDDDDDEAGFWLGEKEKYIKCTGGNPKVTHRIISLPLDWIILPVHMHTYLCIDP